MTQAANPKRLKVVYGWYVYSVYALLILNLYLAMYNFYAREPLDAPLTSAAHSLFIAFLLSQILKKRAIFAWLLLVYFMFMRLYCANIQHIQLNAISLGIVMVILTFLLAGTVVIGQFERATPPQKWLALFGWRQWALLSGLSAVLTLLITRDYLA
ncbi:hypothetical protein ACQ86O_18120 [Serratia sp. L9]|uniref:hypothetical protein n=1 Tax=Serratia sp. L9 TaxID=3423946 RepID=UPI003D67C78B